MKMRISAAAGSLFAVLLATTSASAITIIPANQRLGTIVPGTPSSEFMTEAEFLVTAFNNGTPNGTVLGDNPNDSETEVYTLYHPLGLTPPAPPIATGVKTDTSNSTVDLGSSAYDYVLAKFGQDSVIYWIGNLSGEITIPNGIGNQNGISHYVLYNPHSQQVPDGGRTLLLLGGAIICIWILRRCLSDPTSIEV